jgi:hypothetical protein
MAVSRPRRRTTIPGFSVACVTNQHGTCADPHCVCRCHPRVQVAIEKSKQVAPPPGTVAVQTLEAFSLCPQCKKQQPPGDTFCRADGTRLMRAKKCLDCDSFGKPEDVFCYCCGIEHGKTRKIPVEETAPAESEVLVDRIAELLAQGGKVEVS